MPGMIVHSSAKPLRKRIFETLSRRCSKKEHRRPTKRGRRDRRCARSICLFVLLEFLRDVRGLGIARMDNHAIAEAQRLAGVYGQAAVGALVIQEIVQAKNIRGE